MKNKIGVFSLAIGDEYKNTFKYCINSLNMYCKTNGYDLICDETVYDNTRTIPWSKIKLLLKYMDKYEYLVWIDADILICNLEYKLENFIEKYMSNKNFMMCIDSGDQINTGFMFIKSGNYSRKILETIYLFPDIETRYHEQGPFNDFYKKNIFNIKNNCVIFDEYYQRIFNSTIYAYHYGDFCIHFMGISSNYWINQLSREYYQFKLEDESDQMYNERINKLKQKSGNNRYILPNTSYIPVNNKYDINIISNITEEYNYFKYSIMSLKNYCNKNNYEINFIENNKITNIDIYKYIYTSMLKSNQYIIYIDPKLMICNYDISFDSIIDKYMNDKSILLTRTIFNDINPNIMIFKNDEYNKTLFNLLINFNKDLFSCIETNFFNINENLTILSKDNQRILNSCVGTYKYGIFSLQFLYYSLEGMSKGFSDFYPLQREDEDIYRYRDRLEWIKRFNN